MHDAQRELTIYSLLEHVITLEENYKEMLIQGVEVNRRVELWREILVIYETQTKFIGDLIECRICKLLHIPAVISYETLSYVHSSVHLAVLQYRLSEALGHRFNHFFQSDDIDERIDLCRKSLFSLKEHSDYISPVPTMASLGAALNVRYYLYSQWDDLQEGFELLSSAVTLCSTEPHYLADLGELLLRRYQATGSVENLNDSLVYLRRAYSLRTGHPARGRICRLLASVTGQKDEHFGARTDLSLEALTELCKESLLWQSLGHHSHFEGWDGLGIALLLKFRISGDIHDLNRAIHCSQTACIMSNPQHHKMFRFSANLSNQLQHRYGVLGISVDLELAIFHARCALDLGPADRRPSLLSTLANSLSVAAECSGDVEMLSEAIFHARKALDCVQKPMKYMALLPLGNTLLVKASHYGDADDLYEGIHHLRQLLECCDENSLYYTEGAINVSRALLQQYERDPSHQSHCLMEAIQRLNGLTRQTIAGSYRVDILLLIAKVYRTRFRHDGSQDDLKSALEADRRAHDLLPPGSRLRYLSLEALSEDLMLCDQLTQSTTTKHLDLGLAIHMQKDALKELAEGHPDHSRLSICLAKLFLIPGTPYTETDKGFSLLLHTLQNLQGNVYRCFEDLIPVLRDVETSLASRWPAVESVHKQLLSIYQALIDMLPRLASLDMSSARRVQVLKQARDLATRASTHATGLTQLTRTIELLEAGRAVFWGQHLRLRACFDSVDTHTAKELRDITRRLEVATGSNIPFDLDDNLARARMETVMADRRRLSVRFNELVEQVRSRPGMDRFLRNLDYNELSLASSGGPIVILQTSYICVIPAPDANPEIVSLDGVTNEWLQSSVYTLRQSACASRMRLDSRGARKRLVNEMENYISKEYSILAELWRRIAQPLISVLGLSAKHGRDRPRLFLCPTGLLSFLPIHAAGLYRMSNAADTCCLSDYCIVSYTPTLGALLSAQGKSMLREDVRLLLAAAPHPFSSNALLAVREETDIISRIVSDRSFIPPTAHRAFNSAPNYVSTAEEVLQLLPEATILHLACHGIQNAINPLESGFIMHDRMIEVGDIIRLNLPNAHLAFLSACETAQGDMERPDEALHLAATMLYAGFKSVVGTMWSMGDVDGPVVAETVYQELFNGNGNLLDFGVVPYALDAAVRKLRASGLEPSRWAPYIHIGM